MKHLVYYSDPSGSDGGLWYSGPRYPATTPENEPRFHRRRFPVATIVPGRTVTVHSTVTAWRCHVKLVNRRRDYVWSAAGVSLGPHTVHYVHCRLHLSDWKPWLRIVTTRMPTIRRCMAPVVLLQLTPSCRSPSVSAPCR